MLEKIHFEIYIINQKTREIIHTYPERDNCHACPKCPRSQPSRGLLSANVDAIFLYSADFIKHIISLILFTNVYTRANDSKRTNSHDATRFLSTLDPLFFLLWYVHLVVSGENQCNLLSYWAIIDFSAYRIVRCSLFSFSFLFFFLIFARTIRAYNHAFPTIYTFSFAILRAPFFSCTT